MTSSLSFVSLFSRPSVRIELDFELTRRFSFFFLLFARSSSSTLHRQCSDYSLQCSLPSRSSNGFTASPAPSLLPKSVRPVASFALPSPFPFLPLLDLPSPELTFPSLSIHYLLYLELNPTTSSPPNQPPTPLLRGRKRRLGGRRWSARTFSSCFVSFFLTLSSKP